MKKYLMLLITVLLITGCKANVNIMVDKDKVTEQVIVYDVNTSDYNEIKNWEGFPVTLYFDQEVNDPLWMPDRKKQSGVPYYDVKFNDSNNTVIAKGSFSQKNYKRSSLVNNCFELFNVLSETNNVKIFSTSKGLTCGFSNFDIIVKTPYTVLENNADKVDSTNNIYTWNVKEENDQDISVYLEIDFSKKYNETETERKDKEEPIVQDTSKNPTYVYLILGISFIVLLIYTIIHLNNKKKKNSDI